jgi:hypothetical protein
MKKLFLLTALTTICLFACKKNDPPTPANPASPQTPANPTISPVVYIAGDSFDLSNRYVPFPVYWKNGKQVHLPNASYSSGTGIAVNDSAVYVSSSGLFSGNDVTYWKNSIGVNLADPTIIAPTAMGIALSGKDVYTVGRAYINNYEKIVPIYWKNQDKAIKIATVSANPGEATAIAVSGNDVYITGSTYNPTPAYGLSTACYWKNGVPTFLQLSTPTAQSALATAIFLSGTDIHVVGIMRSAVYYPVTDIATYWKNGKPTALTSLSIGSGANSVYVDGNDVYIAGSIKASDGLSRAAYWKNGVATVLDSTFSVANAITVYDGNVYVAGNRGVDTALYWVNNKPVILGRGRANSITVRK